MEQYTKTKLNDYLYELSTSEFAINKWRKLELITAYKNKSLLYEDVPEYIKEKYDLPSRDEGIDIIKLDDETIIETYQCKDYNGYVSDHELGTYFGFHLRELKNIPFNVVGSNNTKFKSRWIPIIYDTNEIFICNLIINNENNILKNLRWYQKEAIELIEKVFFENINEISTNNEVRIKIPCGCGKTALMYYFGISNLNILILVPKINIGEQIQDYFETTLNKKCNCYWTDNIIECKSNVTICVYNSVDHVINERFDIIFIDEAHHILGSKLYKYYDNKEYYSEDSDENSDEYSDENSDEDSDEYIDDDSYENLEQTPKSKIEPNSDYNSFISKIQNLNSTIKVYLSATIDNPTYELPFDKAIEEEYLSDYEFNILYVNPSFDTNYNQLVEIINENKEYKHIILYCNRIETANYINDMLKSNGIISEVITSEQSKMKRNRILNDFRNELIKVICSVNCLNEGTDLPIADTCMFVNDRGSEINIIQCIGRILRKHQFKNKGRIVLFDSNPNDAELKYEYYLRVLNKIDSKFKPNIKRKLKLYNYVHDVKFDIIKKQDLYFDKIIHFKLSYEDKLELCRQFYDEYNRLPKIQERYKKFNIDAFIEYVKRYGNQNKINDLKNIFKDQWIDDKRSIYTYQQKLNLCKQYYQEFNRIPLTNEIWNGFDIGGFINSIRSNHNQNKINDLKNIFKDQWFDGSASNYNYQLKLNLCKQYYQEFHKIPGTKVIYNNIRLYSFIKYIKDKNEIDKINDLKNIFKDQWEQWVIPENHSSHTYQQNLNLCKQYYQEFNRIPLTNEIYNGFGIGAFISMTKRDQNKINDLKNIFKDQWVDGNLKKHQYQQKLNLCKQYYQEFHKLPTNGSEKYNGFGIGQFIYRIIEMRDLNKINDIEKIFGKLHVPKLTIDDEYYQEKLKLCKQYYLTYNKIPYRKDIFNNWKIGDFVFRIKYKKQHPIRPKLEEIFHCKFD